jgi:hypothetical protein
MSRRGIVCFLDLDAPCLHAVTLRCKHVVDMPGEGFGVLQC